MITRIEFIHKNSFLHRDIKPDNFLMGLGEKETTCYVIDFGLAKRYIDRKTNQHIPYKDKKQLTGTARYASINTHTGIEQSRRDDLEAIGYIFVYFIKGSLPWQGLQGKDKSEKYNQIRDKKIAITTSELCKGLPEQFAKYIDYTKSLKFEEEPDYEFCRDLFRQVMKTNGFKSDGLYDWLLKRDNKTDVSAKPVASSTNKKINWQTKV